MPAVYLAPLRAVRTPTACAESAAWANCAGLAGGPVTRAA